MTYHLCLVCWFAPLFSQTKKSDQKKKHSGVVVSITFFYLLYNTTTIEIYTKRYKEIYIYV